MGKLNKNSKTIHLSHLYHRGKNQIKIDFDYDRYLIAIVKQVDGVRWSQTNKCWYVENNKENLARIFEVFKGKAWVNSNELYKKKDQIENKQKTLKIKQLRKNLVPERFVTEMEYKNYAKNTLQLYTSQLNTFLHAFEGSDLKNIEHDQLINFIHKKVKDNNRSLSYQNQMINAIKIYYRVIYKREFSGSELPRPRKEKKLPNVLSQEEIERIFKQVSNLKHKAALYTIYSCGLRISELINLKINDVDSKRRILIIKKSKGNKDRIVPLSEKLLKILREYYIKYKPDLYLLQGQNKPQYTSKSVESVLEKAVKKAGIKRSVTLHTFRHSYATHLHENGTDIRLIQELLGHKSSKTTEIYTHISNKRLQNIKSPFDDLDL